MEKCLDGELGYSCCDVLKLVKTYVPNDDNKKEATFSQAFYLASLLFKLIELNDENAKEKVNDIMTCHLHYLKDVGNLTSSCILILNREVHEVDNINIRTKLEMFSRLTAYARNPLEPILKLLIKQSKYKNRVSELISSICRGDHISVKMELYELEDLILKGD